MGNHINTTMQHHKHPQSSMHNNNHNKIVLKIHEHLTDYQHSNGRDHSNINKRHIPPRIKQVKSKSKKPRSWMCLSFCCGRNSHMSRKMSSQTCKKKYHCPIDPVSAYTQQ